jgi:hypothetical protein
MKRLLLTLAVLCSLAITVPNASATLYHTLDDQFNGCDTADCVEATTFDPSSNGWSTLCSDNWGCPSCQSNMNETYSVCIKIHYASGWCKCSNPQALSSTKDPVCSKGGSCRYKV